MADFCKACSEELFGKDYRNLAGLTGPEEWKKGYAVLTICEGCGFIQVTPEGECATDNCLKKGQPGHGVPWVHKPLTD